MNKASVQPSQRELLLHLAAKYGIDVDAESREIARPVSICGDRADVELVPGIIISLDKTDIEPVLRHRWSARHRPLPCGAHTEIRMVDSRVSLARFLLDSPKEAIITFRDGNTLNFCTANLLVVDKRRRRKQPGKTSRYLGVSLIKRTGRWLAAICKGDGRSTYLGAYDSQEDAALAYDSAARESFGPAARLNFPGEGERAAIEFAEEVVGQPE